MKKNPFICLHLLSNGAETYISVTDIQQIHCDTSGEGKEGTKIYFNDGRFTMVEEDLDDVIYRIDNIYDPDFYKDDMPCEEELPLPDEAAVKAAARILKRFCSKSLCGDCIFHESDFKCTIKGDYPVYWDIPKGDE